jgi:hypothetical protein
MLVVVVVLGGTAEPHSQQLQLAEQAVEVLELPLLALIMLFLLVGRMV